MIIYHKKKNSVQWTFRALILRHLTREVRQRGEGGEKREEEGWPMGKYEDVVSKSQTFMS